MSVGTTEGVTRESRRELLVFGNEGLGRQAAWRPECLGTTEFSNGWGVGRALGNSRFVACGRAFGGRSSCLAVRTLQGSRFIGDEMFFEGASNRGSICLVRS